MRFFLCFCRGSPEEAVITIEPKNTLLTVRSPRDSSLDTDDRPSNDTVSELNVAFDNALDRPKSSLTQPSINIPSTRDSLDTDPQRRSSDATLLVLDPQAKAECKIDTSVLGILLPPSPPATPIRTRRSTFNFQDRSPGIGMDGVCIQVETHVQLEELGEEEPRISSSSWDPLYSAYSPSFVFPDNGHRSKDAFLVFGKSCIPSKTTRLAALQARKRELHHRRRSLPAGNLQFLDDDPGKPRLSLHRSTQSQSVSLDNSIEPPNLLPVSSSIQNDKHREDNARPIGRSSSIDSLDSIVSEQSVLTDLEATDVIQTDQTDNLSVNVASQMRSQVSMQFQEVPVNVPVNELQKKPSRISLYAHKVISRQSSLVEVLRRKESLVASESSGKSVSRKPSWATFGR